MTTTDLFTTPGDLEEDNFYLDSNGVKRLKSDDRPYIVSPCNHQVGWVLQERTLYGLPPVPPVNCDRGRIPGKRPGTTKQCPTCKGKGYREQLYSRCTTWISCLEDMTTLKQWSQRLMLLGLATDSGIFERLMRADIDSRLDLNAIADQAFESGDGYLKARAGTDMHTLTEAWDRGRPYVPFLPDDRSANDLAAYIGITMEHHLVPADIERFVVCDELKVAGTPDRRWKRYVDSKGVERFNVCGDLKTGSMDFGAGKMAMQEAVYTHSQGYDPDTGERTDLEWDTELGIIIHLPQGEGTARIYEVDLTGGWKGVQLARQVRDFRNYSKKFLEPVD